MNKLFIISFLFLNFFTFGQINKGKIIYNININADDKVLKNDKIGSTYADMGKKAAALSYILSFNDSKTSFKILNKLTVAESDHDIVINKLASIMFTTQFNYYYDFINDYTLSESEGVIVKDVVKAIKWEITSESKIVSGILCYKALSEIEYLARDNKPKFKKIVAWFAPSLPYSFGPKNFYGLPGLILELTENRTTYFATVVDINDNMISIDFPKGKTITTEDYEKGLQTQMGM